MRTMTMMGMLALLMAVAAPAQWPLIQETTGDFAYAILGHQLAPAGDTNGDGVPDVLMASDNGLGRGRVIVLSGADGTWIHDIVGFSHGSRLGAALAGGFDLTGDGKDEFVAGAPSGGTLASGQAFVFSGAGGPPLHTFTGTLGSDQLGSSVAMLPDVSGDGIADILVGATQENLLALGGYAHVYSGADWSVVRVHGSSAVQAQFGWTCASLGDLDGDGVSDYAIGAAERTGAVVNGPGYVDVFSGATGGFVYRVSAPAANEDFSWAIAATGDLDGDGRADFAVGAPEVVSSSSGPGKVYLFSGLTGTQIGTPLLGPMAESWFGAAVAGVGDVNGDGAPDIMVGAPKVPPATFITLGSIYIYSGLDRTLIYEELGQGQNPFEGDEFGTAVCGVGDINGDGFADVCASAPSRPGPLGANTGMVRVWSVCGAEPYGTGLGGTQTLALDWTPGIPNANQGSRVRVSGAAPFATGGTIFSADTANHTAYGVTLLVGTAPGRHLITPITYDVLGEWRYWVDLTTPLIADHTYYLQAFELDLSVLYASNGLALRFSR